MARALVLVLSVSLAVPGLARADVTVFYAPATRTAPLVARTVSPWEEGGSPRREPLPEPEAGSTQPEPRAIESTEPRATERQELEPQQPEPRAASTSAAARAVDAVPPGALLPAPCVTPSPVLVVRANDGSGEHASLALTDCEGRPDSASLAELSLLARPRALSTRPSERELAEHAADAEWVAEGIRRLHPGLVERLRALADHFPGHALEIISGYRPDAREGSRHLFGLAIDVRVRGASLDAVHAFVTRFDRTGVGLYPTSEFIHLDVRARSTRWTDEAGPGEAPRIVRAEGRGRGAPVCRAEAPSDRATAAAPETTAPETTASERATERTAEPAPVRASSATDDALDPDAIADEILRGIGDLPLPPPPR